MSKVVPFLWYSEKAEEAAAFYVSLLPDSRIDRVSELPTDTPGGPSGTVKVVEFTLAGRPFSAMTAEPMDSFNHSVSFVINCKDQAELDRIWDAFLTNGGKAEMCGWLKDKYGVSWQIMPKTMLEFTMSADRERAKRATEAMLKMVKIDIAELKKAYDG